MEVYKALATQLTSDSYIKSLSPIRKVFEATVQCAQQALSTGTEHEAYGGRLGGVVGFWAATWRNPSLLLLHDFMVPGFWEPSR